MPLPPPLVHNEPQAEKSEFTKKKFRFRGALMEMEFLTPIDSDYTKLPEGTYAVNIRLIRPAPPKKNPQDFYFKYGENIHKSILEPGTLPIEGFTVTGRLESNLPPIPRMGGHALQLGLGHDPLIPKDTWGSHFLDALKTPQPINESKEFGTDVCVAAQEQIQQCDLDTPRPALNYYIKCMENNLKTPSAGLCGKWEGNQYYDWIYPRGNECNQSFPFTERHDNGRSLTWEEVGELTNNQVTDPDQYFGPLRQTVVLLIAAMSGELDDWEQYSEKEVVRLKELKAEEERKNRR
jgi:hypothetical protein